jgi:hypothetical protein
MKKQTIPNEPDEMPVPPERPEVKQPEDPQPHLPEKEIEEVPQELPSPSIQKEVGDV